MLSPTMNMSKLHSLAWFPNIFEMSSLCLLVVDIINELDNKVKNNSK